MRTFEMLLLALNLVALAMLAFPRLRNAHRSFMAVIAAIALFFAHVVLEGPRWQMVPAYGLTLLFLVALLAKRFGMADDAGGHRRRTRVAIAMGLAGLAMAVALPNLVPVFRFPAPTGPYAIGTLTYHWQDASRREVFTADTPMRRELMVQIWYPAQARMAGARAAYLPDAGAVMAEFARIQRKPALIFGHLQYVKTNAVPAAAAADGLAAFPVLLFLEGASGFRTMNTYQVEQLASQGYIVVAIDQPGAAAAVVFPDGHQIPGLNRAQLQANVRPSYIPGVPGPLPAGIPIPPGLALQTGGIIPYLALDVVFALDQLAVVNQADPNAILTGKLDLQRVGIFGVSLGGIVVGEACRRDARLRACLMMDAPMTTEVVHSGLRQPSMWITRDAASMRLEREQTGGWPEVEIEAHQSSMRAVYESLPGAGYFVRVPGMFHVNFTDIAAWTPIAARLGLSGPINPQRGHAIINAYSVAFFNRHLLDQGADLAEGPARRYPETLFESRSH